MVAKIYFDQICSGAKKKDLPKINDALRHVSLNIMVDLFKTPAFELAFECSKESIDALDFLQTSYPEERFTLLTESAIGYAFGNHLQAKQLLATASNPTERFQILKFLAYGYALGGHFVEIKKLLDETVNSTERFSLLKEIISGIPLAETLRTEKYLGMAANPAEHFSLLKFLTGNYAQQGYFAEVNKRLSLANSLELPELLKEVIFSYAEANHSFAAEQLLSANPSEREHLLMSLGSGYGRASNVPEINKKIKELESNPSEQIIFIKEAAYGYGLCGNNDEANNLADAYPTQKPEIIREILKGYANAGHITGAKKIIAAHPEDELELSRILIRHCAILGNIAEVENLLASYPNARIPLSHEMMYGYAFAGNRDEIEKKMLTTLNYLEQSRLLHGVISGSIYNCNIKGVEWAFARAAAVQHDELLNVIANSLTTKGVFLNLDSALSMLAAFHPKISEQLANKLKNTLIPLFPEKTEKEFLSFVNKVKQLHLLMTADSSLTYPINYRSQLGTSCVQVLELLSKTGPGLVEKGKLGKQELYRISTFLAPVSSFGASDISKKLFERFPFFNKKTVSPPKKRLLTGDSTLLELEENFKRQKK